MRSTASFSCTYLTSEEAAGRWGREREFDLSHADAYGAVHVGSAPQA